MAYIAPRIEARFPLRQIRQRSAPRLSVRDAAPPRIGPIHEWDKSDKDMSVQDDMRSGLAPTATALRADYDGCLHPVIRKELP
jgi:hypothetical protein